MKSPALRALNAICDPQTAWAITESALQTIIEIAARENPDPAAVAAQLGRPLDNTHDVSIRDGVATIPVEGPLFRHANLMTEISGATSIETLATDLQAALSDPAVKSIILSIDSPGGEVNGTSEFADMLYAARGSKPITAYVADMGASAAYWIASAADEIVLADTAKVGSIGVVAAMRDPNASGAKSIEFVSSQSPNKRPDPTTEKGRSQIQGMVDDLASVFVQTVARNRGVEADTVLSDFGQGGLFVGQKAVEAGLADSVGSYEGVMARLAAIGYARASAKAGEPVEIMVTSAGMETLLAVTETETLAADDSVDHDTTTTDETQENNMNEETNQGTSVLLPMQAEASADPRVAELEARLAALQTERDSEAALASTMAERVAALERENARRELVALTSEWFGSADAHVAIMESLSPENRAVYVEHNRAMAEQIRASDLFAANGVAGSQADDSPRAQIDGMVKALMGAEKLGYSDALQRVAAENPELYAQYQKQSRVIAPQ